MILDGWGIAPTGPGNAVSLARTPNLDKFQASYSHGQLEVSGEAVGLPHGQAGNSEVGHLNLGAGKIVYQNLPRINMSIADGSFLQNPAFLKAVEHLKKNNSRLHLIGLVSPAGVHSHSDHLYALLWFCKQQNLNPQSVKIHVFTDGRDTSPTSAIKYISELENEIKAIGIGEIATVAGRYFAMDRDNRWERTQKAYEALVEGKGEKAASASDAVETSYKNARTDEFILPTVITDQTGNPKGIINNGDTVIFFNFRPDRARQITQAFTFPDFATVQVVRNVTDTHHFESSMMIPKQDKTAIPTFPRKTFLKNLFFVTMTEYEPHYPVSAVAFTPFTVALPIARVLAEKGLHQFHIAETEKYPHVTYFFNGLREEPFKGEDRLIVPSPQVPTYDFQPEMSAAKVTDMLISRLAIGIYDFAVVNYANLDMVGHTGILQAAIKAIETVDYCLGKVINFVIRRGGACVITADHGNVEEMINLKTGDIDTEHTANPVPCIIAIADPNQQQRVLQSGIAADVAPTILALMEITKPSEMTGRNLLA